MGRRKEVLKIWFGGIFNQFSTQGFQLSTQELSITADLLGAKTCAELVF